MEDKKAQHAGAPAADALHEALALVEATRQSVRSRAS